MKEHDRVLETIKEVPLNWWGDYISIEKSIVVTEKFLKPNNVALDWSIIPFSTKGRFGRSVCSLKRDAEKKFNINVFVDDHYVGKEVNYIYVDASLSFIFCYKEVPAFYISFVCIEDALFIRQIQGFPNSSLHNKYHKHWKEKAIGYLINNFDMFENYYLIEENSVIDSLKKLYKEYYLDELHDPIVERVRSNYKKDTYFEIDKKKLANELMNCYTDKVK